MSFCDVLRKSRKNKQQISQKRVFPRSCVSSVAFSSYAKVPIEIDFERKLLWGGPISYIWFMEESPLTNRMLYSFYR